MTSTQSSKELHKLNPHYGNASAYKNPSSMKCKLNIPKSIQSILNLSPIGRILDYGTGKGGLVEEIKSCLPQKIDVQGYDPGVEKYNCLPDGQFDLIICIDVLEHIDRDLVHSTFQEIKDKSKGFVFFAIDLIPAKKELLDGRNAHVTLAPSDWWCQQLKQHFRMVTLFDQGWLKDGTSYPIQLFGCATNNFHFLPSMSKFIEMTGIASTKWEYEPKTRGFKMTSLQ